MTLALGSMFPGDGRRVPVGGSEEQALVGLIQRWFRGDPEARAWMDSVERWKQALRADPQAPFFTGQETPDQLAKAKAVALLRKLLRRY